MPVISIVVTIVSIGIFNHLSFIHHDQRTIYNCFTVWFIVSGKGKLPKRREPTAIDNPTSFIILRNKIKVADPLEPDMSNHRRRYPICVDLILPGLSEEGKYIMIGAMRDFCASKIPKDHIIVQASIYGSLPAADGMRIVIMRESKAANNA